ncbi:uncharacterized protein JCM6883_005894 [Sporobolomyces salmoneus]|uniref:uncharacterized protein n=1 Tax=Sporobolomyces salmoneus TaxID=183962 RepID=UPI00316BA118
MENLLESADILPSIPEEDVDLDRCQLLGPVALIVQAAMGIIVIGGLVIKRMREQPRRQWKIWLADVGKQVVGQFCVHLSNVAISDLIASTRSDNPCSLFALNILIDTTLGVLLIYFLLQYSTTLMQRYQPEYKTGYYGSPFSFTLWAEQAAVYVACLAIMKLVVLIIFWVAPELEDGMSWSLSWIENEEAQVVVVMLILPLVMNLFQFLIVDSIIRSKDPLSPSIVNQNSDEEALRRGFLDTGSDDEDDEGSPQRQRSSRRGSARRSDDGEEEDFGIVGGDADSTGKQKEATELLFDADAPILQQNSARHHYPPLSDSHSNSSVLPPYSTLPPSNASTPRPPRNLLEHSEAREERIQEEEDDGWGENWSASSDVDEDHLKPIPLQPQQTLTSTVAEPLPSISATHSPQEPEEPEKEDDDWGFDDSISSAAPPLEPEQTTTEPTSHVSAEPEEEEAEDVDDWGFDDSITSPTTPLPPPLPDTTETVEKALGLDETRIETQQPTVKAPVDVGKELGGLS